MAAPLAGGWLAGWLAPISCLDLGASIEVGSERQLADNQPERLAIFAYRVVRSASEREVSSGRATWGKAGGSPTDSGAGQV